MPFAAPPPIVSDPPCGPDLDYAFDDQYMDFMATAEGWLSADFYKFRREDIDFKDAFAKLAKLATRTHDLRLFVLAAKLSILDRDIAGFAGWLNTIAALLSERWEEVHPRAVKGNYRAREASLNTLDDDATVVLPLQYATLIESSRLGALVYRAQRVATGAVVARVVKGFNERGKEEVVSEEKFMPSATIDRILRDVELETLDEAHAMLAGMVEAIDAIKAITTEKLGNQNAVSLPKLGELAAEMAAFLFEVLARRDPSRAPAVAENTAEEAAAASPLRPESRPVFQTLADVDAALGSALGYFQVAEPSSPAVLLIRQARETLGKNLYEVMKLLAPTYADLARVFVGPDGAFTVPVKMMASASSPSLPRTDSPPASSRVAALALIEAVGAHVLKTEPSSPVPYLLERARNLAARDFLSLLHDVLPDESLAAMKKGK